MKVKMTRIALRVREKIRDSRKRGKRFKRLKKYPKPAKLINHKLS
jgi:hypothetical protein